MKKLVNRPEDVVEEMLQGLAVLHPGSKRLAGHKVMIRSDAEAVREQQVAVISGGGSGHEPAHAGYIGAGMLSAAVAGEIFTSPSSESVLAAIRAVAGRRGVVLVVKNYTGDRLNFGVAAEMARAEGIPVETIVVDDDVALKGTEHATGARGLAGTVLIHKLVGAAAAEGMGVSEIAAMGRAAVQALSTMGLSFSAGTSPAVGRPSFELAKDEMELGLGIHGEPGVKRMQLHSANELTATLLEEILKHGRFGDEKRVALMVNNMGATTEMELAIVARCAVPFLEGKGFTVERIFAGTFLSSLDMAGISISVLGIDDERLRGLDAATSAPAWPNAARQRPGISTDAASEGVVRVGSSRDEGARTAAGRSVKRAIESACKALMKAEGELTELDRVTGDGDLGVSMRRAAVAVMGEVDLYPLDDAAATLKRLGVTLHREMGGSSGPLYGAFFLRCGSALEASGGADGLRRWAEAIENGCLAISEMGGARRGDRTMLDALVPFAESLKGAEDADLREILQSAVKAAERGAEATAQMMPRVGRSSYLGERVLGHADPGAKAVVVWLGAVCEGLF